MLLMGHLLSKEVQALSFIGCYVSQVSVNNKVMPALYMTFFRQQGIHP